MAIFSRYLLAYGRKPREANKKEAPPISDSLPEFLVAKTDYMSPCSYTDCMLRSVSPPTGSCARRGEGQSRARIRGPDGQPVISGSRRSTRSVGLQECILSSGVSRPNGPAVFNRQTWNRVAYAPAYDLQRRFCAQPGHPGAEGRLPQMTSAIG